ncbi:MAG: hypothetical protein KJI70_02975 [Patescibacteria group bacterium]|nr:hypothetical protein [Patescibacteria group bacterium]
MENKGQQFGRRMWGEGSQRPSSFERKYSVPTKSIKSEIEKMKIKKTGTKEAGKSSEQAFWNRFGSAKKEGILQKFKGGKLFGQTGIPEAERLKYADKIFKLGTGYGSKESLKKEIMILRGKATSGKTEMEQKQARKHLNLLEKVFGKDIK